jgi:hypothetical protein
MQPHSMGGRHRDKSSMRMSRMHLPHVLPHCPSACPLQLGMRHTGEYLRRSRDSRSVVRAFSAWHDAMLAAQVSGGGERNAAYQWCITTLG